MDFFYILMVVLSVLFLYFLARVTNKNIFLTENAVVWFLVGVVLLVFSLFPNVPDMLSRAFGFQVTSNFLLFVAVLFLLGHSIILTSIVSKQKNDIKMLIQEISLMKESLSSKKKEKGDSK